MKVKVKKDIDFKLSNLLIDLEYQTHFTYEQRVDFFNKYGYSTSMPFFEPLYHLSNYIVSFLGFSPNMGYSYGHGKSVLDKLMLEKATEQYSDPKAPFGYKELPKYEYAVSRTAFFYGNGKQRLKYWYYPETDTFKIKVIDSDCSIPTVNVYQKIEQWLKDFGFKGQYEIEVETTNKSADELFKLISDNEEEFLNALHKKFNSHGPKPKIITSDDNDEREGNFIHTKSDELRYCIYDDAEIIHDVFFFSNETQRPNFTGYFEFMGEYIPYHVYYEAD